MRSLYHALALSALLGTSHVQAATATLQPVAGVAVSTVGGAVRVAGGVVAGGYVLTAATLEFLGGATVYVGWRVAGGAAVAAVAASSIAPLVLGGLALGAGAAAIADWLDRAHAAGMAQDLIFDPATGRVLRRGLPGSGYDQDQTLTNTGQTITQMYAANGWITDACANGCTTRVRPPPSYGCNNQMWEIVNSIGNQVAGWCLDSNGAVLAGPSAPTVPTAADWASSSEQLSTVPLSPAVLQTLGKPIPVDPVPVLNPPISPQAGSPPIGAVNPAPVAPGQPIRVADGQPIPIPNTSPAQFTQPWREVTGAGTPAEPWLVNVAPVTTVVTDPTAPTVPITVPANPPVPGVPTGSFYTDCEKFPGSLGCMPVGTPPPDGTIPTQTRNITQQQGPSFGGGGCPANLVVSLHGMSITALNMAQPCSWIVNFVKPIILLLAAISAVMIVAPRSEG